MCAIVDASVAGEVFGPSRTPAGKEFFNWVNQRRGRLVTGGKLLAELNKTPAREWVRQALISGQIRAMDEGDVEAKTRELRRENVCKSNDPHVIALAVISGARLLYSNDEDLHNDFTAKSLIDKPRGKIYSTLKSKDTTAGHRNLLARRDLCRVE